MRQPKPNRGAHQAQALDTPQDWDGIPDWHRNPRRERFEFRLPDQGLPMISLMQWFYEHAAQMHVHGLPQVLILLEGRLRLRFGDGDDWLLQPGEGVLIPAGVRHQPGPGDSNRQALILDVRFSGRGDALQGWLLPARAPRRWRCHPATLDGSLEQLSRLARRQTRLDVARLMHAIWGLLVAVEADAVETDAAPPPPLADDSGIDQRVLYVESIMHRELQQRYDARRLARAIQVSVGQMNRLFRQHRGTTPMQRLQTMRLEQARQYLINSTLSVQQIAELSGFVNPIHFAKLFKESYGQPPRAYRKALER